MHSNKFKIYNNNIVNKTYLTFAFKVKYLEFCLCMFLHMLCTKTCVYITESIIYLYYTINSHIKITQSALILKTIYSLIIGSKIRHFTM